MIYYTGPSSNYKYEQKETGQHLAEHEGEQISVAEILWKWNLLACQLNIINMRIRKLTHCL
jgi:hypothetical protein